MIPLGQMTVAEATENIYFTGNLNASGELPVTGSIHNSNQFFNEPTGNQAMNGLEDLTQVGTNLYMDDGSGGYEVAIEGGDGHHHRRQCREGRTGSRHVQLHILHSRGGRGQRHRILRIDDGRLRGRVDQFLGLDNSDVAGESLGGNILLNANGSMIIFGNEGTACRACSISTSDFTVSYMGTTTGTPPVNPFVFTESAQATGESVRTSFVAYDSLGTAVNIDVTMVLQQTIDGQGSVWEFVAESSDNDALDRVVGLGTLQFDNEGNLLEASNTTINITRTNGAINPMSLTLDFTYGSEGVTAFADSASTLSVAAQDGSGIGHLVSFSVGQDGLITGAFTNGMTRTLGQVGLARFNNPGGLEDTGGGYYRRGQLRGADVHDRQQPGDRPDHRRCAGTVQRRPLPGVHRHDPRPRPGIRPPAG